MSQKKLSKSSWGNYPKIQNQSCSFRNQGELQEILCNKDEVIAFGNGRSYGDSALNDNLIEVRPHDYFVSFDEINGVLEIQAGVLLSEIIQHFLPRGWFLQVTPGTQLITVGGAIASDVHGKNHHQIGCFSEALVSFDLMLSDGEVRSCSKQENVELFRATCGGMGLTGIILQAKIQLLKVKSKNINKTTIKTKNLQETLSVFEQHHSATYSVAWIDCMAGDAGLGRSLVEIAEFAEDGDLDCKKGKKLKIPFYFPAFVLNKYTVKLFNILYYHRQKKIEKHQIVDFEKFFYPLDSIVQWNRIYGKKGFLQYQLIIPKEFSYKALSEILQKIVLSARGSFLAVLKVHGKQNENFLSFPLEGVSLALDFKMSPGLFEFLDELDQIVLAYKGRIYLAKDARVSRQAFEQGYPDVNTFRALRKKYQMDKKFNSLQSQRLGI